MFLLQGVLIPEYRLQYAEKLIETGEYTVAQSVMDNLVTDCDINTKLNNNMDDKMNNIVDY